MSVSMYIKNVIGINDPDKIDQNKIKDYICIPAIPLIRCTMSIYENSQWCHLWNSSLNLKTNIIYSNFDITQINLMYPLYLKPYPRQYIPEFINDT
eukprot:UN17724